SEVPSIQPRERPSQARLLAASGLAGGDGPSAQATLEKLPFVGKAQPRGALWPGRGEGVEWRGNLHDIDRGLVELRMTARAAHDHLVELAVGGDGDLEHRVARQRTASRLVREIERADPLDPQFPAVQVARDLRGACVSQQLRARHRV